MQETNQKSPDNENLENRKRKKYEIVIRTIRDGGSLVYWDFYSLICSVSRIDDNNSTDLGCKIVEIGRYDPSFYLKELAELTARKFPFEEGDLIVSGSEGGSLSEQGALSFAYTPLDNFDLYNFRVDLSFCTNLDKTHPL